MIKITRFHFGSFLAALVLTLSATPATAWESSEWEVVCDSEVCCAMNKVTGEICCDPVV